VYDIPIPDVRFSLMISFPEFRTDDYTADATMVCHGHNRLSMLAKIDKVNNSGPIKVSQSRICNSFDDIKKYHDECVEEGYEGIIIRNPNGVYEFGFRSNDLIKYKEFIDSEFIIIDVVEATGRDAGTAVFVCVTEDGKVFNVKPKGSKKLRTEYFTNKENYINKKLTVRYQGLSDDGIPRFPSGVVVRDYE
jgi:DNA ligase-1